MFYFKNYLKSVFIKHKSNVLFYFRSIRNVNVLLKCDALQELIYSIKIFTKHIQNIEDDDKEESYENQEWIKSNVLKTESIILISSDLPNFLDTNTYKLNGMILFERCKEKFQEPLNEIKLMVHDLHENRYAVKTNDIIHGEEEAYFSIIASSITTPVQIKIPEGIYRTLDGLLQLDCSFNKIEMVGKSKMYLYDGNNEILSGAMIKNLDGTNLELYLRNTDQLQHLLHHIYKNIPDVIVYDESCEIVKDMDVSVYPRATQSFLMDSKPIDHDNVENFLNSLDKQMEIIERTLIKDEITGTSTESDMVEITQEKYKEFRKILTECEKETDYLYNQLNENKN